MSSSLTQKRACAHPVIALDNHIKSSTCLPNCDCSRASSRDFTSSKTCDISLGPTISSRHEYSKDDIAISSQPFRQVDYLSHDWGEEDLLSSWRYIVTKRGILLDHVRLENAAWRTWAKIKNSLTTVPPEALNWRKDHDITWLYGPLYSVQNPSGFVWTDLHQQELGKTDLYKQVRNRPILKRWRLSADTFYRSSSSVSLLDQTAPNVDDRNTRSFCIPSLSHSRSWNASERASERREDQESNTPSQFKHTPRTETTSRKLKCTRFNERVEQCVILDGYTPEHDDNQPNYRRYRRDNDSDHGILIKCNKPRRLTVTQRETSRLRLYEGKGISMLPSTALKSGYDILEPHRADGEVGHRPLIPPFPPQDVSPVEEPMAVSVGTEEANDNLQNLSPSSATERSSLSLQCVTSDLNRSTCSYRRFEEGMTSSLYRPHEEGRPLPRGGVVSLLGEAITSIYEMAYVIWHHKR